jgi:TNF receptor-associated factor 4
MAAHEQDDKLHLHMALDTVNSQQATINSQQVTIKLLQGQAKKQKAAIHALDGTAKMQQAAIHRQDDMAKKQKATNRSLEKSINKSVKQTNSLQSIVKTLQEQLTIKTFKLSRLSRFHLANQRFFWSPPVRDAHFEQVWVDANGNKEYEGTHVSVYAHTDGQFVGDVTITLLNQLEDNNHHTKTIDFPATNLQDDRGYHNFIAHRKLVHDPLKNTQYLKDDTLYFSVSVQAADHKPWLECTPEST